MPELPEVETIRRALKATIVGQRINGILVREGRLRWPVDEARLRTLALGQKITDVRRRAKYLLVELEQERMIVLHLGMSGRLLYLTQLPAFAKHDHVIFRLNDKTELRFRDPRRFGMVEAIEKCEVDSYARFTHLGFEPLSSELTPALLYEKSRSSKKPVKNLLMDASFVVGVGNIYANEALHKAGVHPLTPSNKLGLSGWDRLLDELREVLVAAIAKGGTTLNDFVNSNGETGYFQLSLAVYGRQGEPCLTCGSEITKIVQVGRSSYFCPVCQV